MEYQFSIQFVPPFGPNGTTASTATIMGHQPAAKPLVQSCTTPADTTTEPMATAAAASTTAAVEPATNIGSPGERRSAAAEGTQYSRAGYQPNGKLT